MEIDPNLLTQFSRFQTFALSNKDNTIAERSGDGGLDIQPKTMRDFVGNIGRTSASKMQNKYVRHLLADTIKGMFHVSDLRDLPEPVLSALKCEDTPKGKPLTARRIRAVVTAVQDFISDADEIKKLLDDADLKGIGDDTIRAALTACGGDKNAVQFLKSHVKLFFCDDKGNPRSVAEVKDKIASLVANFADLRKAANGDMAVFEAGKAFLEANPVDPTMLVSIFGDMVKAAGEIKVDKKGFNPSASGAKMHEAVKQFSESFESATQRLADQFTTRAQVFTRTEKEVNVRSLRTFLATAVLAKQGDSFVRQMQETYESPTMKILLNMYYNLGYEASSGDLFTDDPFVPRKDDKDLDLPILNKPTVQEDVIRRLMKWRSRSEPGPILELADTTLASMFYVEQALHLRHAVVGGTAPDKVLGTKFVSSCEKASVISKYDGSRLDADSDYAVQKDFLLRAYERVFKSEAPEWEALKKSILALI